VAVFSKPHPLAHAVLRQVATGLERHGVEIVPDPSTAKTLDLEQGIERGEAARRSSLVISVGGDGTLLSSARAVGELEVPILGVNLGNLGFLTETSSAEVNGILDAVLEGRAAFVRRNLLSVRREGEPEDSAQTVLNDVTFSKKDLARLFSFSLFVEGEWVADYRADGLILATPTGSTAYNLAAGGPIVVPEVDALVATPICPHSLSQRPIILPGHCTIAVALPEEESSADVQMTLDGQVGVPLVPGERILVRRAEHAVVLARPGGRTFFGVLRDKLGWGHP
jgi:NAD+ kinase